MRMKKQRIRGQGQKENRREEPESGGLELERQLFKAGLLVPAAGLFLWGCYCLVKPRIPEFFDGCMWDKWFGVYCLGCGGTRSLISFFTGHPLLSLWYHPMVFYGIVMYFFFMGSHMLSFLSGGRVKGLSFHAWYLYGALIIMVLNCVLKNILRYGFGILMK